MTTQSPTKTNIILFSLGVVLIVGIGVFFFNITSTSEKGDGNEVVTGTISDGLRKEQTADPEPTASNHDGAVSASLSPFDTEHPALTNLQPSLLGALQDAATDAAEEGIGIRLTSGWRSSAYQQHLLDEAIIKYGSENEALRRVATPESSSHVNGNAIDVGPTDAAYWVEEHGEDYGLCQIYANEIWHYELIIGPGESCPPPLTDAITSTSEKGDGNEVVDSHDSRRTP